MAYFLCTPFWLWATVHSIKHRRKSAVCGFIAGLFTHEFVAPKVAHLRQLFRSNAVFYTPIVWRSLLRFKDVKCLMLYLITSLLTTNMTYLPSLWVKTPTKIGCLRLHRRLIYAWICGVFKSNAVSTYCLKESSDKEKCLILYLITSDHEYTYLLSLWVIEKKY